MNTKKGFTLVELLVVIAILAILATVSVVGYTSFINRANNSAAQQELTQVRDFCISHELTGTNPDGELSLDEAKDAIRDCDIEGAAGITWGTVTSGESVKNVAVYAKGSGKAYWVLETGEVTTTAPAGFTPAAGGN